MTGQELITNEEENKKRMKSYVTGFILSIILTLIPYVLVTYRLVTGYVLVASLLVFAFMQLVVQLLFFLHMRQESKPRLNLMIFLSFFGIIVVVIIASIWIMQHLNYNMSLVQMSNVMQNGEGF